MTVATRGSMTLAIDSAPDAALLRDIRSWPYDFHYRAPGLEHGTIETIRPQLPPAFENVSGAFGWCAGEASGLPGRLLTPETLVAKLATTVLQAASGTAPYETHEFTLAALPDLFEQVTLELHALPTPPSPYRPHEDEPTIEPEVPVQLVVGISGSGKTSWAAQPAVHQEGTLAYFDAAGSAPDSYAGALAREIAPRLFASDRASLATVLLPGRGGTESLRALSTLAERSGRAVLVIVDNAQEIPVDQQVAAVRAAPGVRFLLLAQPSASTDALAARLEVEPMELRGWSLSAIAAECSLQGEPIDARTAERLRRLTGGLPLYVRGAASIAAKEYGGKVSAFCTACEQNEHVGMTPQRAILAGTFESVAGLSRRTAAVLSLTTVPLAHEEALRLISDSLGIPRAAAAGQLNALLGLGIVSQLQAGHVQLHDAFRMLATDAREELTPEVLRDSAQRLRATLLDSIREAPDAKRALLTYRLLPLTGDVEELVGLSTDEFFIEYGLDEEFRSLLEAFAADQAQSAEDRFWAYDGLAFACLTGLEAAAAEQHLSKMVVLAKCVPASVEAHTRIAIKRMAIVAVRKDPAEVTRVYQSIHAGGTTRLILDYTYAWALHNSDRDAQALPVAQRVLDRYLKQLGFTFSWLVGKSPQTIVDRLGTRASDNQTLKRVADSLHLVGVISQKLDGRGALHWLLAFKFYQVAHAPTSLLKVGQDIVDELIGLLGDAPAARHFMEEALLPAVREYNLLGHLVPVSAQHAVILAYCGDFEKARAVFSDTEGFRDSLSPDAQRELANQFRLIEEIEAGTVSLETRTLPAPMQREPLIIPKVPRNAPCPCGSGQKYKRCHGPVP